MEHVIGFEHVIEHVIEHVMDQGACNAPCTSGTLGHVISQFWF